MKVEQISVFLENKSGHLSEVARLLGDEGVSMRAITLADTTDFGILRLILDDNSRALDALKKAGSPWVKPRSSPSRCRTGLEDWPVSSAASGRMV